MKKYISFYLGGTNTEYEVPTARLAQILQTHLADACPELAAEEVSLRVLETLSDDARLREFAAKCVTWPQIAGVARLVALAEPEPRLSKIGISVYDEPRVLDIPQTATGAGLMPVDAHLSLMHQANAKISASVLQNSAGEPHGAIIYVKGDGEQVDAYLRVCAQLCRQMEQEAAKDARRQAYPY